MIPQHCACANLTAILRGTNQASAKRSVYAVQDRREGEAARVVTRGPGLFGARQDIYHAFFLFSVFLEECF